MKILFFLDICISALRHCVFYIILAYKINSVLYLYPQYFYLTSFCAVSKTLKTRLVSASFKNIHPVIQIVLFTLYAINGD